MKREVITKLFSIYLSEALTVFSVKTAVGCGFVVIDHTILLLSKCNSFLSVWHYRNADHPVYSNFHGCEADVIWREAKKKKNG